MGDLLFQNLAIAILVEFFVALTYFLIKNEKIRIIVLGIGTLIALTIAFSGVLVNFSNGTTAEENSDDSSDITTSLDCSETTEIGPWLTPQEVIFNPNRDGWVQADFWSSYGQLIEGYDEVSVIFEPSLRVNIANAQGIAWHYDKTIWSQEEVQWCTEKHVLDSWNIRQKRLIIITPAELCKILSCQ